MSFDVKFQNAVTSSEADLEKQFNAWCADKKIDPSKADASKMNEYFKAFVAQNLNTVASTVAKHAK